MSFRCQYDPQGNRERCDKCNALDDQPMVTLEQRGKEGLNVIFIHVRCLAKVIEREKAKAVQS